MKKENKKKKVIFILLFIVLIIGVFVTPVLASKDVAYVFRSNAKVDDNIVGIFEDMNLKVEFIDERDIDRVDLEDYKFVFLGDERFRNEDKIEIWKFPVIISNFFFGEEWGLTDRDGVSKLVSTSPLSVKKDNEAIQVYTKARFDRRTISIPYYYLSNDNKANDLEQIASTFTGNGNELGDVISYGGPGTRLLNGEVTENKVCFFGIIESDYWTDEAEELFEECVEFVGVTCEKDSECSDKEVGEPYCVGNSVFQDVEEFECENPGTIQSQCVDDVVPNLVKVCSNGCSEGECVGDIDCNDDLDCGVDGFVDDLFCQEDDVYQDFKEFTCNNPGTVSSSCSNNTSPRLFTECSDTCVEGSCVIFGCDNDLDCDDNNDETVDICNNPGSVESFCTNEGDMICTTNSDCGEDGFTGGLFCQGDKDLYRNFTSFTCNNPRGHPNFCSNDINAEFLFSCTYACSDGTCIRCNNVDDCDDDNENTIDSCRNSGSIDSFCDHKAVACFDSLDCKE